jgi:hypothetical protein
VKKQTLKGTATLAALALAIPLVAHAQNVIVQEQTFTQVDANQDGTVTLTEFRQVVQGTDNPAAVFGEVDTDGNDVVTEAEWVQWRTQLTESTEDANDRPSYVELGLTSDTLYGDVGTDAGIIGLEGNLLAGRLLATTDRDIIVSGRLMAPGLLAPVLPDFIEIALGGKLQASFLTDPNDDVVSLLPGVSARVSIPLFGLETAAVGDVFYAPDALTFGEANSALDWSANYEIRFLPNTVGFVGFHFLRFDRDQGNKNIVDDVQGGLRFEF